MRIHANNVKRYKKRSPALLPHFLYDALATHELGSMVVAAANSRPDGAYGRCSTRQHWQTRNVGKYEPDVNKTHWV